MSPQEAMRSVGHPATTGTVDAVRLPLDGIADHEHEWTFEGWHGSRWVRACRCGACVPAEPPPAQRRFGGGLLKRFVARLLARR